MIKRRRRRVFLLTHGEDRRLSYCDMGNIAKVDCVSSFLTIKLLQMSSGLTYCSRWWCNIAVWLSLFWVTVERRKVFSRLKQEKLRSAVQLVTGKVRNSRSKLTTSGNNCNQTTLSVNSCTTSAMPVTVRLTGGIMRWWTHHRIMMRLWDYENDERSPSIDRWRCKRESSVSSP